MPKKIRVGILFGGKSAEHEVSLQSAKNVFDAIDREKYEPILIGIDKSGRWLLNDASNFLLNSNDPKLIKLNQRSDPVTLAPQSEGKLAKLSNPDSSSLAPTDPNQEKPGLAVDVIFPILHGPFGEDGTVQGLLKLADIPFVGADVLGSAVGMDKDVMKRLLRDAGLPIANFIVAKKSAQTSTLTFKQAVVKLGTPLFVKPANLGSSVGVSKTATEPEFKEALDLAFKYDHKIIIEEAIPGREIECSVLGNNDPEASLPGEVIPTHDFYSYEAKYIDENGAALKIPADLPAKTIKQIQSLAVQTFQVLECSGLARVDFFLRDDGQPLVNEINTIPGFTAISMYPKLWEASGLSYPDLIDRLIQLAIDRHTNQKHLKTSFN